MAKNSKSVRLNEENYKKLTALSKSNRLSLSIAKLANIGIDRSIASLVKEFGK